ncbi:hypothetical protein [Aeromicrobium sp. IC_218]|uniref:hypothetical protein n=1 Tax=Aeromicrobium sp. IC_218 TaxID=2545468 RepID=UPI00103F8864|nr:hypothetical protein [Aeromicrobium sp. IC_218]TCI97394.1 hypothetical protein E0W78_12540 [Aeromicrobium sp. IC_218]
MDSEIELVSDGEGVVVTGNRATVERFLDGAGLLQQAREFALGRLSNTLRAGSDLAELASGIAEQSAMYLKLTPESTKTLKDAGGLMKTKTEGVSHAMLGDPGNIGKWLQVEDGPASLLTNPAVLSGVGGLMGQLAQQAEAQELKALLIKIDAKLDDVRRGQRNAVLAKVGRAAEAIEEAMTIHEHEGDPKTLWSKVNGESGTILEVQRAALLALGDLAEKVQDVNRPGQLKKLMCELEQEVGLQLSVLARCFELQDQFRVIELDYVLATAPERLDGHRSGVAEARENRRARVLETTSRLMDQLTATGGIANENVLLHARAASSVFSSLNTIGTSLDEFHAPLNIAVSDREALSATPWRAAMRDPQQLKTAGTEVSQKALVVGGGIALLAVGKDKLSKPSA